MFSGANQAVTDARGSLAAMDATHDTNSAAHSAVHRKWRKRLRVKSSLRAKWKKRNHAGVTITDNFPSDGTGDLVPPQLTKAIDSLGSCQLPAAAACSLLDALWLACGCCPRCTAKLAGRHFRSHVGASGAGDGGGAAAGGGDSGSSRGDDCLYPAAIATITRALCHHLSRKGCFTCVTRQALMSLFRSPQLAPAHVGGCPRPAAMAFVKALLDVASAVPNSCGAVASWTMRQLQRNAAFFGCVLPLVTDFAHRAMFGSGGAAFQSALCRAAIHEARLPLSPCVAASVAIPYLPTPDSIVQLATGALGVCQVACSGTRPPPSCGCAQPSETRGSIPASLHLALGLLVRATNIARDVVAHRLALLVEWAATQLQATRSKGELGVLCRAHAVLAAVGTALSLVHAPDTEHLSESDSAACGDGTDTAATNCALAAVGRRVLELCPPRLVGCLLTASSHHSVLDASVRLRLEARCRVWGGAPAAPSAPTHGQCACSCRVEPRATTVPAPALWDTGSWQAPFDRMWALDLREGVAASLRQLLCPPGCVFCTNVLDDVPDGHDNRRTGGGVGLLLELAASDDEEGISSSDDEPSAAGAVPLEVLHLVLEFLQHPRDLAACAAVCVDWRAMATTPALWRRAYMRKWRRTTMCPHPPSHKHSWRRMVLTRQAAEVKAKRMNRERAISRQVRHHTGVCRLCLTLTIPTTLAQAAYWRVGTAVRTVKVCELCECSAVLDGSTESKVGCAMPCSFAHHAYVVFGASRNTCG